MLAGSIIEKMVFEKDRVAPRTCPKSKTIWVPAPRAGWSDAEYNEWFGQILHEIGHWMKGYVEDILYPMHNNVDMRSMYGSVLNVLSDFRQDNQWYKKGEMGAHVAVSTAQTAAAARGLHEINKMGRGALAHMDDASRFFAEVFSWYYSQKAVTMPMLSPIANDWVDLIPHQFDKYNDELHGMSCTDDVITLLNKIIQSDAPEGHNEIPEQPSSGEGEGDEQGKGGSGGEAKDGDPSNDGEEVEGKGTGKDESSDGDKEGESEGGWVSYRDMLLEHDHSDIGQERKSGSIEKIIYDHDAAVDYTPRLDDRITIGHMRDIKPIAPESEKRRVNQYTGNSKSLANQTRRIIQIHTQRAWQHGVRNGKKLSGRMLHRVPVGGDNVFKRRTQAVKADDCVFSFLGDWSASMDYDDKRSHLIASFMMINDALRPLNVRYEMSVFTDNLRVENFIVKGFNERISSDEMRDLMCGKQHRAGANADGESLEIAFLSLMQQPEKKKVLVVLSDGMPASYAAGDAHTHLRMQVDKFSKYCTIYGIGLLSESVKDFYRNHFIVRNAADLEECFLNLVKENIV